MSYLTYEFYNWMLNIENIGTIIILFISDVKQKFKSFHKVLLYEFT